MKENICDKTINSFLELDKDESLGFKTTLHLLTCKKCRTVVRLYTLAQRSSSRPLYKAEESQSNAIHQIVQKANPSLELLKSSQIKPVSMTRWLISGLMLVVTIFIFSLLNETISNSRLQVTIYLCFSAFICAFCAFFIGSNLDFFIKKIDKTFHSGQ